MQKVSNDVLFSAIERKDLCAFELPSTLFCILNISLLTSQSFGCVYVSLVSSIKFSCYSSTRCHAFSKTSSKGRQKIMIWDAELRTPFYLVLLPVPGTIKWSHNGCYGAPNHLPHYCLLNRLFTRRSKKMLRVTGFVRGIPHNGPATRKMFPFDGVIMLPRKWNVCAQYAPVIDTNESSGHDM